MSRQGKGHLRRTVFLWLAKMASGIGSYSPACGGAAASAGMTSLLLTNLSPGESMMIDRTGNGCHGNRDIKHGVNDIMIKISRFPADAMEQSIRSTV